MSSFTLPAAVMTALLTGLTIACLGPVNSLLQARIGTWSMLTVVHLLGLGVAIVGFCLAPPTHLGTPGDWTRPLLLVLLVGVLGALLLLARPVGSTLPAFAWWGGALGLLVVVGTVQAIGVLGAVRAVLLIILAELVGAALIDTFGLFGRPVLPLNPGRIAGLLLVLGGALLTLQAGT